MKKYIHINQHVIKSNHKNNKREPVITVKTYNSNTYGHQVHILGECKVVYSPDKPLSCGAKVWIETDAEVINKIFADVEKRGNKTMVQTTTDTGNCLN